MVWYAGGGGQVGGQAGGGASRGYWEIFRSREVRRLILLLMVLTAGVSETGCKNRPRQLMVGKDYKSVQEAINAARRGDTVMVRTGVYKEQIRLKDAVTLAGVSRGKVVLEAGAADGPVVRIEGCKEVRIESVTVRQTGAAEEMGKENSGHPAVLVRNSQAKISGCRIEKSGDCGIAIDGGSECEVIDCNSENNKRSGIMAVGEGAKVTIERNVCAGNKVNGIYLKDGASGQLSYNDCTNNEASGISAVNCPHKIVIEDSNCSGNLRCGIYVERAEFVTVANNSCRSNGWSGIFFEQTGMGASVKANNCSENQFCGIYLRAKFHTSVSRNICAFNGANGISVADEKGNAELEDNCCIGNRHYGIWYSYRAKIRNKNNIGERNGYLHFSEIRSLLKKKDFAQLEGIAGLMRDNKLRFDNGNWQLDDFYNSLVITANINKWTEEQYKAVLQEWIAQYPDSVTPQVALTEALVSYGWRERGSGWASEVSEEGWAKFRANLKEALQVAMDAEQLKGKDPVLYRYFLQIGLGLHSSSEQMDEWMRKGLVIEPEYFTLYIQRARAFMPRWYGKEGELEAFARKVTEQTEQKWGQSLYAEIAAGLLSMHSSQGFETFLKYGFVYERLKQGFERMLERYPAASYNVNTYCIFASIYKDKEKAKELFDKIGENWDVDAWVKEEYFKRFRDWAYEDKK